MNQSKPERSKPLEDQSRTISSDGVMVRVQCVRINGRIEVRLDGAGQRAAIDLPVLDPSILTNRIEQVARGFAASVRLRLRDDGRLP